MSVYSQVNLWDTDDKFRISKIKDFSPNKLIDLGCGNGRLTFPMSKFANTIIGIDPDNLAIQEAIKLDKMNSIKWIVGDSNYITDRNIDCITMFTNVSQEIIKQNEWIRTLNDCYNALNKNGVLIFDGRNFYQKGWLNWTKEKTFRKIKLEDGSEAHFWHEVYNVDDNIIKFNTYIGSETYDSSIIFRTKNQTVNDLRNIGFKKIKKIGRAHV